MTVRMDPSAQAHLDAAVAGMLGHLGEDILADAQQLVRVRSGRLRNSLDFEVAGRTLRVGSRDVGYSVSVELGTAPHVIRPKDKKALFWEGAAHPVGKVNHPGTPAMPYLRPAMLKPRGLR